MVGLLHERPQRGHGPYTDLGRLAMEFDTEFRKYCVDVEQGRPTPEKKLQSFLIRDAYRNHRKMALLNKASMRTKDPVELIFVTDEIRLPVEGNKVEGNKREIGCDFLAVRKTETGHIPVLIELKSERTRTELVGQVNNYSPLIVEHAALFGQLYTALLGRPSDFGSNCRCEKWIVWPVLEADGLDKPDNQEKHLAKCGIRVVGYLRFSFRVGEAPT